MMRNLYLLAMLIGAIISPNICAQNVETEVSTTEKVQAIPFDQILPPVIYGKKTDGLPRNMKVRGVIEEISVGFIGCGLVHWYGTVKMKLLDKVKGYEHEYVYFAATCFFTMNPEIKNMTLEVKLSKLNKDSVPMGIINTIDSGGVAFYNLKKILSPK